VRIVSLVPAATEIVCALGLGDQLVGVTHDCDHPDYVRDVPRITGSTIPADATSGEIDALVRAAGARGESTFHLDGDALREVRPDLVLGQTICRVCALTLEQLPPGLPARPTAVPLTAETLDGVFDDIRRVAAALGVHERGDSLVADLRRRIDAVARRIAASERPRVACLEWVDPLFNGGHWVPEQVWAAGGRDVLGRPGERSRVVDWAEVREAAPDILVVMPCGFRAERALREALLLAERPGWEGVPAVRDGRVFAADGAAYFSRPGPRLVDGVEILAALFHPSRFPAPDPAAAVRVQSATLDPEGAAIAVAAATVAAHPDLARGVVVGRPKAWGSIAAKAIVAYRERARRALGERERRRIWDELWREIHRRIPTG